MPASKPRAVAAPDAPKEPHEIEMDRKKALLAKVRVTRERMFVNQGAVKRGRPGMHYVWVNINKHRQIAYRSLGYELVVNDPEVETEWLMPDGTHVRADLILYQISEDLHEAMKIDDQLRALEALEDPKETFAALVDRAGAVVYEPPVK